MTKELHSIKKFRGTTLGVIRLNNLAFPGKENMKITVGNEEIFPIGFDTYGHPVIASKDYLYYLAKKANTERNGDTLVAEVEYKVRPFCIRRNLFDSIEAIKAAIEGENDGNKKLGALKDILINRKLATYSGNKLNNFIIWNKYLLSSDGKIYLIDSMKQVDDSNSVILCNDVITDIERGSEFHVPSSTDTCAICGKSFSIDELKDMQISEDEEASKIHIKCEEKFNKETNFQKASQIIDAVYDERPPSEIRYVEEGGKSIIWYVYKTYQGTIAISFKTKVIVIKWGNDFKPFNMELFDKEKVTKGSQPRRFIHAWGKDAAINYLAKAKNA